MLYHLNYGNIRAFSLFCALGGFLIYRMSIGRPVRFLMSKVLVALKKVIYTVLLILIKPIRSIFGKMLDKKREKVNRKKARKYLLLMEQNVTKKG
jgi:hypothetical protein